MSAPQLLRKIEVLSARYDQELGRMERMRGEINELIVEFDILDLGEIEDEQARAAVSNCLDSLSFEFSGSVEMLQEAVFSAGEIKSSLSAMIGT